MRNSSLLIVLCLMLSVTSGCATIEGFFGGLTPTQIAPLVDTGATTAASIAVTHKVIKPALAAKIVVVLQAALPTVQTLQTSNDITTALLPVINTQLAKVVTDPTELTIATSTIQASLNLAVNYLNTKYPAYKNNQPAVVAIVSAAVQGTIDGLNQGIAIVNAQAATSQPATK